MIKKGCKSKNIYAAIGPCISQKNYNVKKDLLKKFLNKNKKNSIFFKKRKNVIYFDLPRFVISQLKSNKSNSNLNQEVSKKELLISTIPAVALITLVLGAIITGIASPTESAAIGCLGAMTLAFGNRRLNFKILFEAAVDAAKLSSMVFAILIGATAFSLVFKTMGGDFIIREIFTADSGKIAFLITSMLIIFILGFFLDFIEICFILVPILLPVSVLFEIDPLWFAILIAINLQTSFLTPPFGFSIFYLKAAAKNTISTQEIYRGVIPFVMLQLLTLFLVITFPKLITWLPNYFDK